MKVQFLSLCDFHGFFLPWVCTLKRQVQEVLFKKLWATRSRTVSCNLYPAEAHPPSLSAARISFNFAIGTCIYSSSMPQWQGKWQGMPELSSVLPAGGKAASCQLPPRLMCCSLQSFLPNSHWASCPDSSVWSSERLPPSPTSFLVYFRDQQEVWAPAPALSRLWSLEA